MKDERYVVGKIGNGYYIIDKEIPFDSFHKKYYGTGDKKDKPYKQKKQAQLICDEWNKNNKREDSR